MYAILNVWKSLYFKLLSFISYNDISVNRRRNKKKLPPNIVMKESNSVYLPSIRLYIFCEIRRISQKGIWISVTTIQNYSNQVWNQSKPKQDQFKCNEDEGENIFSFLRRWWISNPIYLMCQQQSITKRPANNLKVYCRPQQTTDWSIKIVLRLHKKFPTNCFSSCSHKSPKIWMTHENNHEVTEKYLGISSDSNCKIYICVQQYPMLHSFNYLFISNFIRTSFYELIFNQWL